MAQFVPTRLVTFGPRVREYQEGELVVRVLAGRPVRGQENNPFSARLLAELGRADVVHCHQQHVVACSAAAFFCRLTGRRVFVSDLGGGGWDISAYVSTDRWYHGHLHISEYSRTVYGHAGKPWARVILGGVDTAKFRPDPSAPRGEAVVYVGRFLPHKGVNYLIEAVPRDMPLELIGRPYSPRYFADLQRLADGKRVTFRTDCEDDALVDAYRRALCVVLPSVYCSLYGDETRVPELLGQTLLEGMACAIPAVCTDVASMPEVVRDGVTGYVVPPNDPVALREKLCWLKDHPAEARAMGQSARQRVLDHFTWPAVVDRCLAAYRG
jgi:glycosyltransferase involved in cell wall biosynthesis